MAEMTTLEAFGSGPSQVLIVDDDKEIRDMLSKELAEFGMMPVCVSDGQTMRTALSVQSFDLLILDLMLPGEDGLSICRRLRPQFSAGIIMLSARGELADRVAGLELGADDYLTKPFEVRELIARMRTVLRRCKLAGGTDRQPYHGLHISFDGWRLDRATHQLTAPDQVIVPLSRAEFRLLCCFVEQPRRVLTREQLLEASHGHHSGALDRSVDLLVSRLRQKLGENSRAPTMIKTVRGEGYLFDTQVTR